MFTLKVTTSGAYPNRRLASSISRMALSVSTLLGTPPDSTSTGPVEASNSLICQYGSLVSVMSCPFFRVQGRIFILRLSRRLSSWNVSRQVSLSHFEGRDY